LNISVLNVYMGFTTKRPLTNMNAAKKIAPMDLSANKNKSKVRKSGRTSHITYINNQ
jgi:hypothetical protein